MCMQQAIQQLPPAYEVRNPSFNDMTLEQQVAAGINDWLAEGVSGHPYFGQSKDEAEAQRRAYNYQ